MPGLNMSAEGGSTTLPVLLLYLHALAEVSKIVVTVVLGGGVGMALCCCMASRHLRAMSFPCTAAAANCSHFSASERSCVTPWPLMYMTLRSHLRMHCAIACLPRPLFRSVALDCFNLIFLNTFLFVVHDTKVVLRLCIPYLGRLSEPFGGFNMISLNTMSGHCSTCH